MPGVELDGTLNVFHLITHTPDIEHTLSLFSQRLLRRHATYGLEFSARRSFRYKCATGKKEPPIDGGSSPVDATDLIWSGRLDSNQRPHAPQACALPGCATSRQRF